MGGNGLRVGLDLSLIQRDRTGLWVYGSYLSDALQRAGDDVQLTRYASPWPFVRKNVMTRVANGLAHVVWNQVVLPLRLWRAGMDLLHALAYFGPLACPAPLVVTYHALTAIPVRYLGGFWNWYFALLMKPTLARADRIIVVSESLRRDLLHAYRLAADKVRVIYPGVSSAFRPLAGREAKAEIARRFPHLPEKYVLWAGEINRRKNVPTLLQAFRLLKDRAGVEHKLVLAGGPGLGFAEVEHTIADLGLRGDVVLLGHQPHSEMPCLYNGASAFVYPSLYEGFGSPLVEAMACGCPVATSNAAAMPEVVADAGKIFDPRNAESIAESLEEILTDPDLAVALRAGGLERARQFSWGKAAAETLAVYREVAG
ncbi:MAG: glycosyltransferase family 4 protein [Candidatus Rokubacteria bacterium]|nr:glycosyltransferase family 4 protein [Candidatus Rokubacteria bacterium]